MIDTSLKLNYLRYYYDVLCLLIDSHAQAMWVYGMAKELGRTFSTNHLSYIKTLVPISIFRAITFFWWCHHFWGKKWPFCPKIKKTLSWAIFQETLIVASPFQDMCLDIYGAWINQNKSFDWDIILENIESFAKNGF